MLWRAFKHWASRRIDRHVAENWRRGDLEATALLDEVPTAVRPELADLLATFRSYTERADAPSPAEVRFQLARLHELTATLDRDIAIRIARLPAVDAAEEYLK